MSSPLGSQSTASARSASSIRGAPLPPSRGLRVIAAEHDRSVEEAQLVELAGVEERAGERRAALEQDAGDAAAPELGERRPDPVGAVARADDRPRRRRRVSAADAAAGRHSAPAITITGASATVVTSFESSGSLAVGVEDDAARLALGADVARGQQRVVGERGADADGDRVGLGAPAVDELAGRLAGDPLRVAGAGGGAAVERQRRLEDDERAPGAGVLAEGLVEEPRRGRLGAVGPLDLDAAVAEDAGPAAARLRARVVGGDDDAGEPGGEDRVGAGRLAARGARRARASRTSSLRPGPRRARARPRSRRPRRAGRRAGRGSPRRSSRPAGSTITAPTSGFGLTRPRPRSASSSARRIGCCCSVETFGSIVRGASGRRSRPLID